MAYTLKIWTFNEKDGWAATYDPLPETLMDARSLANWWIHHLPERKVEVQILRAGEIIESVSTDNRGHLIITERRDK